MNRIDPRKLRDMAERPGGPRAFLRTLRDMERYVTNTETPPTTSRQRHMAFAVWLAAAGSWLVIGGILLSEMETRHMSAWWLLPLGCCVISAACCAARAVYVLRRSKDRR